MEVPGSGIEPKHPYRDLSWQERWGFNSISSIVFFLFVCLFVCFCFFSFFFLGLYLWHMEVPTLGVQSELWTPTGLHHSQSNAGSWAASATYTTAHGNARSITHWTRPGIEPVTLWFLLGLVSAAPWWELPVLLLLLFVCLFFYFLGLCLWHMEVPRLGLNWNPSSWILVGFFSTAPWWNSLFHCFWLERTAYGFLNCCTVLWLETFSF